MSVSVLPVLFAAILFGPLAAMAVGACALAGDFHRPYLRWFVWTCQRANAGGLAGLAALMIGPHGATFGRILAAVVAAAVAEALADVAQAVLTAIARGN